MSKSKFAPLVRGPVRLVISILALITGLYHVSGVAAGAPSSPSPVTPPDTVPVRPGEYARLGFYSFVLTFWRTYDFHAGNSGCAAFIRGRWPYDGDEKGWLAGLLPGSDH